MLTNKKFNILIVPDSFKESLSSNKVAAAISKGLQLNNNYKNTTIKSLPFADGGEGSLEVLKKAAKIKIITIKTYDSLLKKTNVKIGLDKSTKTGYIEMAQICGLQMLKPSERNPMNTTTYGIGEAIKKIIKHPVKKIVLFIGGSSTNDAGCGMMQSLGLKYYDKNKNEFKIPITGKDLVNISYYNNKNIIEEIKKIKFLICCDVKNTLYGKNGAAYIYGKQKGANTNQIKCLNKGLVNISNIYEKDFHKKLSDIKGGGAAGGIAISLIRFFNTSIVSGSEYLSDLYKLDKEIKQANLIITGEGRLDNQSLSGKLISVIYNKVNKYNKKMLIICGDIDKKFNIHRHTNILDILTLTNTNITKEYAMRNTYTLLKNICKKVDIPKLYNAISHRDFQNHIKGNFE